MQSANRVRLTARRNIVLAGISAVLLIGAGGYGVLHWYTRQQTPTTPIKTQRTHSTPDLSTPTPPVANGSTPGSKSTVSPPAQKTQQSANPTSTGEAPANLIDPPTDNTIFAAAYTGKLDELRKLIKKTPRLLNAKDPVQGATPLLWATVKGRKTVVQYLLSRGAQVNVRGNEGWTPLQRAAYGGYTDVVKLLLAKGADINATDGTNGTALLKAAGRGNLDTVKLLLARHPKLDVQESDAGLTALHAAIISKRKDMVAVLIAAGANVNTKAKDGSTPLIYAQATGQEEVASMLKKAGAK